MWIMNRSWAKRMPETFREAFVLSFCRSNSKFSSSQDVLRPWRQQSSSHEVQVRQREHGEQACRVLRQSPVAHLGEAPQLLHDTKGMLAASPSCRAQAVQMSLMGTERLASVWPTVHSISHPMLLGREAVHLAPVFGTLAKQFCRRYASNVTVGSRCSAHPAWQSVITNFSDCCGKRRFLKSRRQSSGH